MFLILVLAVTIHFGGMEKGRSDGKRTGVQRWTDWSQDPSFTLYKLFDLGKLVPQGSILFV